MIISLFSNEKIQQLSNNQIIKKLQLEYLNEIFILKKTRIYWSYLKFKTKKSGNNSTFSHLFLV